VGSKTYALFGPTGVAWEAVSPSEWIARLPAGKGYLSVAALPDDKADTLSLFVRHAYAFIKQTRVAWRYDEAASHVETTFSATTQVMEGPDNGPLLGLYPHQWYRNASVQTASSGQLRHRARQAAPAGGALSSRPRYPYNGFVPHWPAVGASPRLAELKTVMEQDLGTAGRDIQRQGTQRLLGGQGPAAHPEAGRVFEQQGDNCQPRPPAGHAEEARRGMAGRQQRPRLCAARQGDGRGVDLPRRVLRRRRDQRHHFWYGYFIRTAAEMALRDPAWIAKDRWGGMIELLIADIATTERGRSDAPFCATGTPTRRIPGPTALAWASSATTTNRRRSPSTPGSA
jgi:hypothetical protein